MSINETTCGSQAQYNNPACIAFMANYCSIDSGLETYEEKWQGDAFTSECRAYVELNQGQQFRYVPVVDAYARQYLLTENKPITYAQQGSLVYDPAIEDLIDVCQSNPGGCDNVLEQKCAGFLREDLKANPNLGKLCGCFMSDSVYDSYTGAFGVEPICDPACTLQSAVKPRDPAGQFATLKCNQTICVMDDIKIELLNNTTTGDINFSQACASCGTGSGCTCNISDISITAVESSVKNVSFEQQCGIVNCFKSDANGVPQSVPCSSLEPGGGTTSPASRISATTILIIIGIIILLIIIIIVIVALVRRPDPTPAPRYEQGLAPPPAYSGPAGFDGYGGQITRAPMIY